MVVYSAAGADPKQPLVISFLMDFIGMKRDERMLVATIVAPLIVPIYFVTMSLLERTFPDLFTFWFAVAFAYGGTLLVGIPAVMVLKRLGALMLTTVCLAGALGGILVGIVFMEVLARMLESQVSGQGLVEGTPMMAGFGFAVALIWGLISGVHRRFANSS